MNKKQKIILLSVISVILVALLSIGLTTAFMKPIEQGGNLTEIALSSCAKIKLTSTSSINLSNTYPMSRNKGFETSPYNFTVTSYCDTYVGFNLYIATLSTNTLDASNIHYILTYKGSKNVIKEGILSSVTSGVSDFSDTEKTELNTGLKGTYGSIYKLYNESIPLKGSKEYSLYLYVDESATNSTMDKTFIAGVAVKAYEREKELLNDVCTNNQNLTDCIVEYADLGSEKTNIYYHDGTLENGINDGSYRYAGPSDQVNNFVCFGSTTSPCPENNLYRIIGVIDGKIKLIKYDYMTTDELGTDGDYAGTLSVMTDYYKGTIDLSQTAAYGWGENTVGDSEIIVTNLNTNFINYLGTEWTDKIATVLWGFGANTWENMGVVVPSTTYKSETSYAQEISSGETKIGLMYVSDYGFAASPSAWTLTMEKYNNTTATNNNWMYMGLPEWTLTRCISIDNAYDSFQIYLSGELMDPSRQYDLATIRAVFYLEPTVKYISGSGTMSDPIRIN